MTDRATLADRFLAGTDWAQARRAPLAGDASNRRYERLHDPARHGTAVLMDAPPDRGEDVRPFVRIARFLNAQGLSAPDILAADPENGFLLLEDFGDDLFARIIPSAPQLELPLYEAATDVLVALHRAPLPDLDPYDVPLMTDMAELAFTKYQAAIGPVDADQLALFRRDFGSLLDSSCGGPQVMILRDYHAENMLWLPDRFGLKRVGLLDFQSAMSGHPAYDLVSMLQDARRDVSSAIQDAMVARYVAATDVDDAGFRTAYAVLGVQRNMRILGIFARLSLEMGKPSYIDLIPRVWNHLQLDLAHPALTPVAQLVREMLPQPTDAVLGKLRP